METNQKMLALYGAVMLATMSASGAVPPAGPLRLHPDNPHYFDWRGKPTVLITAGEHYGAVLNLDFDYIAYLDELARCQFNLTRVFSGTYREVPGSFNLTGNTLAPASGRFLGPWARSDTPGVADGGHKFDLTQWDDRYFARLKDFIRQANQRGVVVELVLFCTMYDDKVWEASPMHARNNVNDIGGVSKYEVYSAKDRPLFEVQQAVVRKLVTELNAFDNLYYEVCNEPYERGGLAESWNDGIIATIIEIESVLPNQHLIAQGFPPSTAPVADLNPHVSILNFHAAKPVANVGIPRLASPTPPWFNAPVQLRLLARKPGRHLIDLKFLGALARDGCAATLAGCWLLAQVAWAEGIPLANIHIRDPFILPVEQARSYYLVASSGRTVTVRQSEDLKTWGEPKTVFAIPENFWGGDAIWAPEIHEHRGRYYLFATFMNKKSVAEQWTNWPARIHRGTQVLVADSPLGPFKPFANRSHTPTNEMALDGTLWVEDGSPYMVYCHEWVQVRDGGMKLVRLSEDLSGIVGEPQLLFKGSEAPWAPRGRDRYVTDGPSLYRSKSGKLFMLWSSFSETGYTTGIAVSDSGKVAGSWRQQAEPFFRQDGGHAMIFPRFDGGLMLALHSPNRSPDERCRLIEIEDTGDTLVSRDSSQPKTATGTDRAEAKEPWVLAYFRQRYESRVEIDADGQTRTVPLPNPMKEEQLHLALSTDGRHWEPLNGNRPVWNQ
ncbi:MAG TPA: family 43 glycosylhydrolase, partial [Candidatus Paceibacterota bacterium]|nr:family 43 glycosylhydrolase [Candidatus Paceibacterota bacterium]